MEYAGPITSIVLALTAIWLGSSLAAIVTGAETWPALGPSLIVAGSLLISAMVIGRRSTSRHDTAYW